VIEKMDVRLRRRKGGEADGGGGGWVGRENGREGLHDGFGEPTQVEYPIQFDFQ
jgi:hypothetical protein